VSNTTVKCTDSDKKLSLEPCDIERLTLVRTKKPINVTCTRKAIYDRKLTKNEKEMLGDDDLLFELVADYENSHSIETKDSVSLIVGAINTPSHHISTSVNFIKNQDLQNDKHTLSKKEVFTLKPVFAHSSIVPITNGRVETELESWIDFWRTKGTEKVIHIYSGTCGINDRGKKANTSLSAKVIIYRRHDCVLSLKVPAFKKLKKEYKNTKTLTNKNSVEGQTHEISTVTSVSEKFGADEIKVTRTDVVNTKKGTNSSSLKIEEKKGTKPTLTSIVKVGAENSKNVSGVTEDFIVTKRSLLIDKVYTAKDFSGDGAIEYEKEIIVRPKVTFSLNGSEIKVTTGIETALNLVNKVVDALNAIEDFLPKAGLSVVFEIAAFEMDIKGKWGHKESNLQSGNKRIALVEPYYGVNGYVKILDVKLGAFFGIKHDCIGPISNYQYYKLEIGVSVTLGLLIDADIDFKYSKSNNASSADIEGVIDAKAKAELTAALCGFEVGVKAEIDTFLDINAQIICDTYTPLTVEGSGYLNPLVFTFTAKGGDCRFIFTKEWGKKTPLFEEQKIQLGK